MADDLNPIHVSPRAVGRIVSLDVVRFLAALVVFVQHFYLVFELDQPAWLLLGIFDAKGAVTLFFVLSGYVLAASFTRASPSWLGYARFLIRRVLRIFPLYWVALLLSAVVLVWQKNGNADLYNPREFPATFLQSAGAQIGQWFHQFTLVSPWMKAEFALPPVWTLTVEMRVALLFPLLAWFFLRVPVRWAVVLVLLLNLGSHWLAGHVGGTLALTGQFAAGIVLARAQPVVLNRLSEAAWLGILVLSLVLYSSVVHRYAFPSLWAAFSVCTVGCSGLILGVQYCRAAQTFLARLQRSVRVDLSYGTYILHYPVMMALRKLWMDGWLPQSAALLFGCSLALTLVAAFYLNRHVEMPLIRWGKKITGLAFLQHGRAAVTS